MERLTFNAGSQRGPLVVSGRERRPSRSSIQQSWALGRLTRRAITAARERRDWDYLWMLAFTALLFFRPQDHLKALEPLHLAELTAIAGLAAMATRRLSAGQPIVRVNTELIGIIALGAVIILTTPFSIWPGGSIDVFSDIYVKIILIFALMVTTLTSPKRLRQMTWIMVVASGYIAARAVADYVRGVNLVEGDRVRGAVGGMFENPNDLSLNLVTFLAPTLLIIGQERRTSRRLFASALAATMFAAIICTKSRSGFLGLVAMGVVVAFFVIRVRPGVIAAAVVAAFLTLPVMPQSFWDRMNSIVIAAEDPTGSRAQRLRLIDQALDVFTRNPLTGIGAGQFQNYNEPGTLVRWRVTHNVWLQVAAELGIFGLVTFAFLVVRAFQSSRQTLRILRRPRRKIAVGRWMAKPVTSRAGPGDDPTTTLTAEERHILEMNAKGMLAGFVGWLVCSMFASVAFNWTFYYVLALAVAGRDIAMSRRVVAPAPVPEPAKPASQLVRAHA